MDTIAMKLGKKAVRKMADPERLREAVEAFLAEEALAEEEDEPEI